ncbi:MAG: glycosyltransferase family 2 protein [Oscillospiraceae bacterium]|nr:glycosyltransferase family 2 protein [Oscillospiraceae bacterium]
MWLYVAYGFILFSAVIGLAEIIGFIERKLMCCKTERELVSVIPLRGRVENVEQMLRDALTQLRWQGCSSTKIIVIDLGIDDETKEICRLFADESGSVKILQRKV